MLEQELWAPQGPSLPFPHTLPKRSLLCQDSKHPQDTAQTQFRKPKPAPLLDSQVQEDQLLPVSHPAYLKRNSASSPPTGSSPITPHPNNQPSALQLPTQNLESTWTRPCPSFHACKQSSTLCLRNLRTQPTFLCPHCHCSSLGAAISQPGDSHLPAPGYPSPAHHGPPSAATGVSPCEGNQTRLLLA